MERQKARYIMGYCIAMIMIATVWLQLRRLPSVDQTTEKEAKALEVSYFVIRDMSPKLEEHVRQKNDDKNVFDDDSDEIRHAYEELYPDMYVRQNTVGDDCQIGSPAIGAEEEKYVYLTFDDGPSERTENILDALGEEGATATFFLIGSELTKEREPLVRRMIEEGHTVGIHTYSHKYQDIYTSVDSFLEDFHKAYVRVYEVTGVQPVYFRFPWGSINCYSKGIREDLISEMERRGFCFFDWNVSAEDSVGKPTEYSIYHNVVDTYPRFSEAVVLMHDSASNRLSAKVLPQILEHIKKQGYKFGRLEQMATPYQWKR